MEFEQRITVLKSIYAIYEEAAGGFETTCGRHCAACCTCNVTCTTLEGGLVFDHLRNNGGIASVLRRVAAAPRSRYRPAITLNQMVEMCIHDLEVPEEVNDPAAGPCSCLETDLCSLYAVRPFGCRAMLSTRDCRQGGEARMPPFILSLNNVMMQYLEAFDRPGGWGNLIDVLDFFTDDSRRQSYKNQACDFKSPLLANRPFPVLMIPPGHRERMQPILERVHAVLNQSR